MIKYHVYKMLVDDEVEFKCNKCMNDMRYSGHSSFQFTTIQELTNLPSFIPYVFALDVRVLAASYPWRTQGRG